MPYFGGTSLAQVLSALDDVEPEKRQGRHILVAIDRAFAERTSRGPITDGPYRRYLEQASYVQAVCWIVACLADGLHEAHVHGLIHMDVKPSNVLIAGDGLPMLLDFHLARKPIKKGERIVDRLGGTPSWMAPEQQAALKAVTLSDAAPDAVDHRADLYSLGLLLCEALGGAGARHEGSRGNRWGHRNPQVSVGLEGIVQKCLAPNPADRYLDAASVADDLRRHLNDLPLRGVPNRNWAERWRKWRRRQPGALTRWTSIALAGTALTAALVLAFAFHHQRLQEVETALGDARRFQSEERFAEAIRVLNRTLERAPAWTPGLRQFQAALKRQINQAKLGQATAELHDLAEIVRFRYGMMPAAGEEARALIRTIKTVWEESDLLLKSAGGTLDSATERSIRSDLMELAIVRADLTARLAPKQQASQSASGSPGDSRERRARHRTQFGSRPRAPHS